MQKRSVPITTLIIICCILTLGVEFGSLYFVENPWFTSALAIIGVAFICNLFLELSFSYETGAFVSLILEIGSLSFLYITKFSPIKQYFPFSNGMIYLVVINWLIPFLFLTVRYFLDRGPRFMGYNRYFVKTGILFWFMFSITWVYFLFSGIFLAPVTITDHSSFHYIPFLTTSTYIEQFIYKKVSLLPFILYILKYIAFFLPFGFYLQVFQKKIRTAKWLIIFLFPILVEIVQYFIGYGFCDIDDAIWGILGMLLGTLLFRIINICCYSMTGSYYLETDTSENFCFRKRYGK